MSSVSAKSRCRANLRRFHVYFSLVAALEKSVKNAIFVSSLFRRACVPSFFMSQ